MTIDANALLLSFAISGVGFVCFSYGKRQGDLANMLAGVILLAFPYFVSSLAWMAGITVAVLALLFVVKRFLT